MNRAIRPTIVATCMFLLGNLTVSAGEKNWRTSTPTNPAPRPIPIDPGRGDGKPTVVVRDHRIPGSGAGGVTVTSSASTGVIRDHRSAGGGPIVRDHRQPNSDPIIRDHRTLPPIVSTTEPKRQPVIADPFPDKGPVVRDHRDNSGGITTVVRDHRSPSKPPAVVGGQPVVRDHRQPATGPIVRDHRQVTPVIRDHR
jgi:uncharacterized protein (DUF433 family)